MGVIVHVDHITSTEVANFFDVIMLTWLTTLYYVPVDYTRLAYTWGPNVAVILRHFEVLIIILNSYAR